MTNNNNTPDPRFDLKAIENNQLKLDDKFSFHCQACGSCCRDREDILLSTYDIFRASKYLNLQPEQFINKYCESYIGHSSKVPIVRLKPKPVFNALLRIPQQQGTVCPLLTNDGHCLIHSAKPAPCATYPLGRYVKDDTKKVIYFLQNGSICGENSKSQTVREWLTKFNIFDSHEAMVEWSNFIGYAVKLMEKFENFSDETLNLIYNAFFQLVYVKYDIGKEFMPQLKNNIKSFKELMQGAIAFAK